MIIIESEGKVYELDNIVGSVSLTHTWKNGASKLEFECLAKSIQGVANGNYMTFSYNGTNMFAGKVFTVKDTNEGIKKIVAYDQLRYLKAKDTLIRKDNSLTEFIETIACNLQLRISGVTNTLIKLDDYLFDNMTYLDMAYRSISDNLLANGYYYCLYDDFGALVLKDLYDMRTSLVLGDNSLVYNFDYERSVDKDTFNQVKLAFDNKTSGKRDIYITKDSNSISQYGLLQYFEKVTGGTAGQLIDKSNMLLKLKNRETKKLSLSAIGDLRVRGGTGLKLEIKDINLNCWAIVDKVVHKFDKGLHEMNLDLTIDGGL